MLVGKFRFFNFIYEQPLQVPISVKVWHKVVSLVFFRM